MRYRRPDKYPGDQVPLRVLSLEKFFVEIQVDGVILKKSYLRGLNWE